jgi:crotonobetainyl-CoA:carnitine CoA-transferase CaiB-like acyl-CoA transferase
VPRRLGNAHPNIVPYQVFETGDGHAVIAVGNDRQFRDFCEAIGRPELAADIRFSRNADRVRHRDVLVSAISAAMRSHTRDALLRELEKRGVPSGPINSVEQVFRDPQIVARGMRVDLPAPDIPGGSISSVRTPIVFSDAELTLQRPAPRLGEHTEEVMRQIGFTPKGFTQSGRS